MHVRIIATCNDRLRSTCNQLRLCADPKVVHFAEDGAEEKNGETRKRNGGGPEIHSSFYNEKRARRWPPLPKKRGCEAARKSARETEEVRLWPEASLLVRGACIFLLAAGLSAFQIIFCWHDQAASLKKEDGRPRAEFDLMKAPLTLDLFNYSAGLDRNDLLGIKLFNNARGVFCPMSACAKPKLNACATNELCACGLIV